MISKATAAAVLGVDEDASLPEIRAAYLVQAKALHPDTNAADPNATERFQQLGNAYTLMAKAHRKVTGEPETPDDEPPAFVRQPNPRPAERQRGGFQTRMVDPWLYDGYNPWKG